MRQRRRSRTSKQVKSRFKQKQLRRTLIKDWRKYRGLTQVQLAERVSDYLGTGISYASIGRIENAKQPYGQRTLEGIADALQCAPWDLLWRRPGALPSQIELMARILERANESQRGAIVDIASRLVPEKTGTEG